jgi:hypothetical protein
MNPAQLFLEDQGGENHGTDGHDGGRQPGLIRRNPQRPSSPQDVGDHGGYCAVVQQRQPAQGIYACKPEGSGVQEGEVIEPVLAPADLRKIVSSASQATAAPTRRLPSRNPIPEDILSP